MSTSKHSFTNVDQYISLQPQAAKKGLDQIRQLIRKAAPEAIEVISYGMPGYKLHGSLVFFAAWKNHIGFYVLPSGVEAFKDRLTSYKTEKSAVHFSIDKPIPAKLVTDIVKFRVKENLDIAAAKQLSKSKPAAKKTAKGTKAANLAQQSSTTQKRKPIVK